MKLKKTDKPESFFDEALAEAIIDKYGTNKVSVPEVESALNWAKWTRDWLLKDACTNSRGGLIQRARKDLIEENQRLLSEVERLEAELAKFEEYAPGHYTK